MIGALIGIKWRWSACSSDTFSARPLSKSKLQCCFRQATSWLVAHRASGISLTNVKLFRTLVARKACILDCIGWPNVHPANESQRPFWNLLAIGVKVPRLLENSDSIMIGIGEHSAVTTIAALHEVMAELETFKDDWCQPYDSCRPYQRVPISQFGDFFKSMQGEHVFQVVFDFTDRRTAYVFSTLTLLLLSTSQALLDLSNLGYDVTDERKSLRDLPTLNKSCVEDLCCSIPYQSSADQGYAGSIGSLPMLRAVADCFQTNGMTEMQTWCQNVVSRIYTRGVRSALKHFQLRPTIASLGP